jgi:long-chain acyl-CoA synthetase
MAEKRDADVSRPHWDSMDATPRRYAWEEFYPPNISWREPLRQVPVQSMLENAAAQWPERTAIDFYDFKVTFRELRNLAARAAKGFQTLGVTPGVRVGLHLPNTPHHVICFFGILMAGGCAVNFSPLAALRELEYQLTDSEVEVIVTLASPAHYPRAAALMGKARLRTIVVCSLEDFLPKSIASLLTSPLGQRAEHGGREIDFAELIATDGIFTSHPPQPPEEEVAALLYTGGTTGDPKGAMLTHGNLSAMVSMYDRWFGAPQHDGSDRRLVVTPLFHISGLSFLLLALSAGVESVLHIQFDSNRVLAAIAGKKITLFHFVPTMYTVLAGHSKTRDLDLSSMRFTTSGGAPLPSEVIRRFKELTGVAPREGYALTETTGVGTMQARELEPVPGNVGPPLPGIIVEIVDVESGSEVLPSGELGEICFKGPQMMKGYWNKPDATREAFRGGRFHTGDIGFIDAQGYVTVVDRKKDMIISGGYNVFPRIVEEAIYHHPAVAEVMVIGIPDPTFGQLAKAFVVLKEGQAPFGYNEMKAFLTDRLASYEMPTALEFRPSLPKTAAGKLSKKELVAQEAGNNSRDQSTKVKSPVGGATK